MQMERDGNGKTWNLERKGIKMGIGQNWNGNR